MLSTLAVRHETAPVTSTVVSQEEGKVLARLQSRKAERTASKKIVQTLLRTPLLLY